VDRKILKLRFSLKLVQERLKNLDIKKIVLASTTGATAEKAMDF